MSPGRPKLAYILATILVFTGGFFVFQDQALAAAGINKQVNFQGKLVNTNGTNVPDGTYNMEFKIYQDGDGVPGGGDETLKWTEDRLRNNSQGVTVTDGIFQVNLGSVTAFSGIDWNQSVLWVSINVGNTNATCTPFSSCVPDGEMNPMVRFTAAPYALNAEKVSGLTVTNTTGTLTILDGKTISFADAFATSGAFATTLTVTNTTNATLPSGTVTLAALGTAQTWTAAQTFANSTATDDTLGFSITTGGAGRFAGTLTNADLTGAHSWILPNADGTVALTGSAMTGTFDGVNFNTGNQGGIAYYSATDAMSSSAAGTAGQALISGGTGSPTWYAPTAGSVLFAGAAGILSQDNSGLFWNSTDNYLGIGTAVPEAALHIGSGSPAYLTSANSVFIQGELEVGETIYLGPMELPTDGGTVSWIDMPVVSAVDNTPESYTAYLDSNAMLTIYGLANGSGGVDNLGVGIGTATPAALLDVSDVISNITTGKALNVASTGTGLTSGSLIYVSSATTGAVATNGIVSLNASGNYTSTSNIGLLSVLANSTAAGTIQNIQGNALTTGNALYISTSSTGLTSGNLLSLSSSGATTGFTGALANISFAGNNANNTGQLLKVTQASGANTTTPLMVTNLGAGISFRVNDETGDADTTPFVVDATGNVGIGDTSPDSLLDILSSAAASTYLKIANTDATNTYDSAIQFELDTEGTVKYTMGVDNNDSEKFKISTTALGTNDRLVIDASALTFANSTATDDTLGFAITTGGAGRFAGTLTNAELTGNHSWILPNADGTVALTANNLGVFAATTSAQLSGVLSDENTSLGYMTDPMTTIGDIIIAGALGVPARLAGSGTNGWVLTYNTGTNAPEWAAGGGGHTQNTDTGTTQTSFIIGSGTDAAANNLTLQFGGSNQETLYFDGASTDNFLLSDDLDITGGLTTTTAAGIGTSLSTGTTATIGAAATYDPIILSPVAKGTTSYTGTITSADLTTTNQTWTFPDLSGTVALTANNLSVFASTTSTQLSGVLSDENTSLGYMTDPMTTIGDIIIAGALGVPARLAGSGTNGWVLTYNTGTNAPEWAAGGGGHTQNTDTGTDGTNFTIGDGSTTFTVNTSATNDTINIEQGTFDSILSFTAPGAATQTYTFATGGNVCTDGAVCSGYSASHSHPYLSDAASSTQAGYFGDIYMYDDGTPSHYLQITNSGNLTGAHILSLNTNDADRTVSLSGDLTLANSLTTAGNFGLTFTTTNTTNATLPAGTVTLAALGAAQTWTAAQTFANATATDDTLGFSITTGGAGRFAGTLTNADLTGAHSWILPNADGTVALTANNLSVFAATTSAQLSGVLSDENTSLGYMTDPMTTIGDIIIAGALGVPARLAGSGTNGWVLTYNTGTNAPEWAAGGGGGTLQSAYDAASGNTILTTTGRNIAFTLGEVAAPTSFTIENQDTAGTNAQYVYNSIASGTLATGLLIEQTGIGAMTDAIKILETAGAVGTGINIGNNVGTGISIGTGVTTGISVGSGGITITAGALAVNSDSITSDGTLVINANGNVDIQDILNADSITTDTNGVTIAAGGSYSGAGAVTLDSGTTTALNIGTGANAKTITLGNITGATAVNINAGTGASTFAVTGTGTLTLGGAAATGVVTVNGGTSAANTLFNNVTGGTIAIGVANTGGITIGNGATAKTIAIGTGAAVQGITIGSTNSTSSLLLQGGTGNVQLQSQGGTLGIGNNAVAQTITLGNVTGATALNIDTGTGGINFGDNANTKTIDIGGVTNSGTDTVNIATNGTAADVIAIGNSNASTTLALTGGDDWNITAAGNAAFEGTTNLGDGTGADTITLSKGSGNIVFTGFTSCTALETDASGNLVCGADDLGAGGGYPDTATFTDSSPAAWTDSDTTELFDDATKPNIVTDTTSSNILITVQIHGIASNTQADSYLAARIVRTTNGSNPSCASATNVGVPMIGGFTTTTSSPWQVVGTFIDNPVTAGTIKYTVCTSAESDGTATDTPEHVIVNLVELGADLAENYYTSDDSIEPGDVVAIDGFLPAGIKKSGQVYDQNVIGVVSTNPGITLDDAIGMGQGRAVPVALSGRIPVKVSTENGRVKAGDYLTASSAPGVAMKATKAGLVIGQALQDFSYPDGKIGLVLAFVKNTYFNGERAVDENNEALTGTALLQKMLADNAQSGPALDISEIVTDKIYAGLEIVTPKVITQELAVDQIKPSLTSNIAITLGPDGQLIIGSDPNDPKTVFDANGNATFAGIVTAKTLRAENIEGLEFIQTGIQDAQDGVAGNTGEVKNLGQEIADLKNAFSSLNEKSAGLDADIIKDFELKEGLVVGGPAEFRGPAVFKKIAEFIDKVIFRNNVEFAGQVMFNQDTAGYAIVKEGQDKIGVTFEKEYAVTPIINASLSLQQIKNEEVRKASEELLLISDVNFIITNVTEKGFEIKIGQKAMSDIPFSWQAMAVKDAKTFSQDSNVSQIPGDQAMIDNNSSTIPVPTETAPIAPVSTSENSPAAVPPAQASTDEQPAVPSDTAVSSAETDSAADSLAGSAIN